MKADKAGVIQETTQVFRTFELEHVSYSKAVEFIKHYEPPAGSKNATIGIRSSYRGPKLYSATVNWWEPKEIVAE